MSRAELETVVRDALHDVVAAHGLSTAQVFLPVLGERAVMACRLSGDRGPVLVRHYRLGSDEGGPGLLVTTGGDGARLEGVAALLARLVASETARQQSVRAARAALVIANRDPDTSLGNRRAWVSALRLEAARATRQGRCSAVVVIDLDGLKTINDRDGHSAGDRLITRTAEALLSTCRETDVLCRLGGDEFGMVAPDTSEEQVAGLLQRLRHVLAAEGVRASIGAALLEPGSDIHAAWHEADARMYADKARRRSD